jgi:predicted dehydrogenase
LPLVLPTKTRKEIMNLSSEQKQVGMDNYYEATGVSRRDFMKGIIATGAVTGAGLGAAYFGYTGVDNPVRIGVIGTGDEGNVLINAMNPAYHQVVAIADIRPYNIHRAFHGDWASVASTKARCGLMTKYGWTTEDEARKHVQVYDKDYRDLLKDPQIEAVVIAVPLFAHAQIAIDAMKAGKHVMTEKLMAHNVAQCKVMSRVSEETGLYLATGHQRHYSVLYDNAVNLLQWGLLGQLHHIRAQWHRGNLPGHDSWQQPIPGGEKAIIAGKEETIDKIVDHLEKLRKSLERNKKDPAKFDLLQKQIAQWVAWDSDKHLNAANYGYETKTLPNGRNRSAMEELCRWRLWQRTGGGLMAELGSHQLDAASIFISALRKDGKKAYPLSVHAVGGRHIFAPDRECEDHVYCMFEFPGPEYDASFDVGYQDKISNLPDPQRGIAGYDEDPNKKIMVSYSSINGNGFGGHGEVVMGTKGTLVLDREQEVMVFMNSDSGARIKVEAGSGGPTMDTQGSGGPTEAASLASAASSGPVSRGYTEELEHWAWCIRNASPENQPRCTPTVALGDAVIALTSNVAIKQSIDGKSGYIKFEEGWFDIHNDSTPDKSDVPTERASLGA